jgi:hypothetical protein
MVTLIHFMGYTDNESFPRILPSESIGSDDEAKRVRLASLHLPPTDDPRRGCVMPKFTSYNPVYEKNGYKVHSPETVKCKPEPDWLEARDGSVHFTKEAIKKYEDKMKCTVNYMKRTNDFKQEKKEPAVQLDSADMKSLPLEDDYMYVDCKTKAGILSTSKKWSNLLAGVHVKPEVLSRHNQDFSSQQGKKPLNILVFGFDSVSHVNFMKRLPKLYSLIVNELGGIVLDNYNIVGDGTTAAMTATFAGGYEEDLPEVRRGKSSTTCDIYPWIWKDYKKNRYVTVYAEDESSIGTFQYRLNGFKDPPTDHYMRPFHLQAELDHKKHPTYCLGSRPKINILMDYLKEFFTLYPSDVGKFVFGFHSEYSHGVVEQLSLADDPVTEWIRGLKDSGILDNTIMMVMSDHGHRFSFTRTTLQGKYEERLPFFSVIVPKWFKEKFPHSYRALQVNALDRLLSPFDINASFKTILHHLNRGEDVGVTPHDKNNMTRGLSIFQEIPLERSCSDAHISNHWCACNQWKPADPKTDKLVNRAAQAIIDSVNELIKESGQSNLCERLQVKTVNRSQKMMPKKELLAFKQSSDHDGYIPDFSDKTTVSLHCFPSSFSKSFSLFLFLVN